MINAYCVDPIIIIKWEGPGPWGEPLPTSEVDVMGNIEYGTFLVRDLRGEEVISNAKIRLPISIEDNLGRVLRHEDKLKFDGVEHTIKNIQKPKAFTMLQIYWVYVA